MEKGASQRASKVIYDREYSAIALASKEDFNWNEIFAGADWFHWTGITPALGGELPQICLEACKAAKERGITISCDLNYRKKLWMRQQANEVMSQLMQYVDVCIANEEDASGAAICMVACVQVFINYIYDVKKRKLPIILIVIYSLAFLAVNVITFKELYDVLSLIAALLFVISVSQGDAKYYRILYALNSSVWIFYDFLSGCLLRKFDFIP